MGDYTFDDEGNPIKRSISSYAEQFEDEEDVTSIFDIKGEGFDVTLSLANGNLSMTSVNPKGKKSKTAKLLSNLKKSGATIEIPLQEVLAVKIKRLRSSGKGSGEGYCLGFSVYVCEKFGPNCLRDRVIDFEHPSETLCSQFANGIFKYISELPGRPKAIKMFLQAHAGSNTTKHILKTKVLPLFLDARVSVDCLEIQHCEHVKQEMIHMNLDDYDCIIATGGDGTVKQVTTGLMNAVHANRSVEIKPGFAPVRSSTPLGIIPTGLTNQIAKSVMGITDPLTATIHIILGHKQATDVCSVFHEEKPLCWSFISQYGFGSNVLHYSNRYRHSLVPKSIDAGFFKSLSKSKLRPYNCEIEYIPADPLPRKHKNIPCRVGCDVCWDEREEEEEEEQCLVQPFNPLANSNNSDTLVDLSKDESPWRTCKGTYLNVGLYCLPGNSELAPLGLSKNTHLNDGCMELVLVKETERKNFVRYLKRHGNKKDQFDFDFVEVHRVKEVKFRPRLPTGWNYNDHGFNEIKYRMSKLEKKMSSKSMEVLEINDGSDIHEEKSQSMQTLDDISDDEDDDDDDDVDIVDESSNNSNSTKSSADSRKKRSQSTITTTNNVIISSAHQDSRLIGPRYRMTFAEVESMKRKTKAIKKETKKKEKEAARLKCHWNLDNEIHDKAELDFRVHHGLLNVCGQGIAEDTVFSDSTVMCLPVLK